MASPSTRERILDHVVATIQGITIAGGYNNNIGECLLGLKHFEQAPSDTFPHAYVAGADEARDNTTNQSFLSVMTVVVIGYVKAADASNLTDLEHQVSRFVADIEQALMIDVTRGNDAIFTKIAAVKTDKGAWVPYAGFELSVTVQYRAKFTTP